MRISKKKVDVFDMLLCDFLNDIENMTTDIRCYGAPGDQHVAGRLEGHSEGVKFIVDVLQGKAAQPELERRYREVLHRRKELKDDVATWRRFVEGRND